jgi:hypothetical protein
LMECKSGLQFALLVLIVNQCHEMTRLSAGRALPRGSQKFAASQLLKGFIHEKFQHETPRT